MKINKELVLAGTLLTVFIVAGAVVWLSPSDADEAVKNYLIVTGSVVTGLVAALTGRNGNHKR